MFLLKIIVLLDYNCICWLGPPSQLYNTLGLGCYQQSLCVYREGGGEAGMSEDIFIKQKHNRDILFSPFTRPHWIELRQDGLKGGQSKTIRRLCAYNRT